MLQHDGIKLTVIVLAVPWKLYLMEFVHPRSLIDPWMDTGDVIKGAIDYPSVTCKSGELIATQIIVSILAHVNTWILNKDMDIRYECFC